MKRSSLALNVTLAVVPPTRRARNGRGQYCATKLISGVGKFGPDPNVNVEIREIVTGGERMEEELLDRKLLVIECKKLMMCVRFRAI